MKNIMASILLIISALSSNVFGLTCKGTSPMGPVTIEIKNINLNLSKVRLVVDYTSGEYEGGSSTWLNQQSCLKSQIGDALSILCKSENDSYQIAIDRSRAHGTIVRMIENAYSDWAGRQVLSSPIVVKLQCN